MRAHPTRLLPERRATPLSVLLIHPDGLGPIFPADESQGPSCFPQRVAMKGGSEPSEYTPDPSLGDAVPVIVKERPPPLALMMVRLSLWEISRDCGEADRDPKLRKFSPDLSGSPAVLICESTNEGLHLSRNYRPSGSVLRDRSPVEPKSPAVPADHGVELNDDQDLFPSRPDLRQEDPEAPIGRSDPGSAAFLGVCGQLLTKGEFNDRLLVSASKERRNTAKEDRREFEQVPHSEMHSARVRCSIRD